MAEEVEACASVHLSFDQLGFGVHAFCSSIVEWLGEGGVCSVAVELESTGECVQVGQTDEMPEHEIIGRIDQLIDEEHELRQAALGTGLSQQQRTRLTELETQLDQCWDLLRQRRALAASGQDPTAAHVRQASEVESYEQ